MSKIMNLVMDLQDYGVLVPEIHDQEPDAKSYMETEQYAKEYAEFEKQNIQAFIDSVKEHTL